MRSRISESEGVRGKSEGFPLEADEHGVVVHTTGLLALAILQAEQAYLPLDGCIEW